MNFTARLAGVAAALCLSFGAVAADNGTQPITDQDQCHSCDMWITKYPGPKAEIVTKSGHVYKFCSTKCMTCTLLRLGESDKIAGIWVNDMVGNDWEHPDATFIDAKTAWYVQGSSRKAARLLQHRRGRRCLPEGIRRHALPLERPDEGNPRLQGSEEADCADGMMII